MPAPCRGASCSLVLVALLAPGACSSPDASPPPQKLNADHVAGALGGAPHRSTRTGAHCDRARRVPRGLGALGRGSRWNRGASTPPSARHLQLHRLLRGPGAAGGHHLRDVPSPREGPERTLRRRLAGHRRALHACHPGSADPCPARGTRRPHRRQPDHHRGSPAVCRLFGAGQARDRGGGGQRPRGASPRDGGGPLRPERLHPPVQQLRGEPRGPERRLRGAGPGAGHRRPRRRAPRGRGRPRHGERGGLSHRRRRRLLREPLGPRARRSAGAPQRDRGLGGGPGLGHAARQPAAQGLPDSSCARTAPAPSPAT